MAETKIFLTVVSFVTFVLFLQSISAMPLHASCRVQWNVTMDCEEVGRRLVAQIDAWGGPDGCANGGEKCLYTLVSNTSTEIKAKHETPKKHYVDDLTFTLAEIGSLCQFEGYSRSETWYAVLDYSTNYCNLRNLVDGSGLNSTAGFNEVTSDSICTQYSSRNCNKY